MVRRIDFDELDHHDPKPWPNEVKKRKAEPQFRGLWIPADICDLVEDGTILIQEAFLLATIDRFVNSRGLGCWASNTRLAKHMGGLSTSRIQQMIRKLISLDLVRRVPDDDHERVLETTFSRVRKRRRKKTRDDDLDD